MSEPPICDPFVQNATFFDSQSTELNCQSPKIYAQMPKIDFDSQSREMDCQSPKIYAQMPKINFQRSKIVSRGKFVREINLKNKQYPLKMDRYIKIKN